LVSVLKTTLAPSHFPIASFKALADACEAASCNQSSVAIGPDTLASRRLNIRHEQHERVRILTHHFDCEIDRAKTLQNHRWDQI
jgi:hypothetical protein